MASATASLRFLGSCWPLVGPRNLDFVGHWLAAPMVSGGSGRFDQDRATETGALVRTASWRCKSAQPLKFRRCRSQVSIPVAHPNVSILQDRFSVVGHLLARIRGMSEHRRAALDEEGAAGGRGAVEIEGAVGNAVDSSADVDRHWPDREVRSAVDAERETPGRIRRTRIRRRWRYRERCGPRSFKG